MKEYKLIFLNKKMKLSRENDIAQAEETINQMVSEGWSLQQVVCPVDLAGAMIAIFYKEKN